MAGVRRKGAHRGDAAACKGCRDAARNWTRSVDALQQFRSSPRDAARSPNASARDALARCPAQVHHRARVDSITTEVAARPSEQELASGLLQCRPCSQPCQVEVLPTVRRVDLDFFATPGPLTELAAEQSASVTGLGLGALDLCRVAQGLLVAPHDAFGAGLSDQQMQDRNQRRAGAMLQRAFELGGPDLLGGTRPPERRVVGSCRHFAVLATAFLRACGVPARARCGFASYFIPPRKVDHWVVEYWSDDDQRWIRVDPEYLDIDTPGVARPHDLRPGEFLDAGEAWLLVRSGQDDAASFGVFGTDNWGAGEIRGNAMRDLASVAVKIEMLPWDEWGPMADSYRGATGDDFDELIDQLATATSSSDLSAMRRVYARLAVPASMVG